MSVKQALLALLADGDRYGYQLRAAFEEATGGVWPLNIGQVYTTLDRLERDGLVSRSEADDARQVHYGLTDAGHQEAATWWTTPVELGSPSRDDAALKIALAVSMPEVDTARVIQVQRAAVLSRMQDLTRARHASGDRDSAWALVADAMIFRAEAEVRWLDHTAARLANGDIEPGADARAATTFSLADGHVAAESRK
ncbi:PadR family transcriptional regulator [Demequina aestuarii]|uniref:PadR family transcriptional regulator n=1 Tax=Demequina aestuarii TaxID=327095 RepID=UPI000784728B|nr:PadR family transcriptional regulator [Demequina aestuarii]